MPRRIARLLGLIASLPVLYFVAGLAGALIPGPDSGLSGPATTRIGLIRGVIHYDFLIPLTPEVRRRFGFARAEGVPVDDPDGAWLLIGWGARGFYTSTGTYADISAGPLLRGVTGDRSVMRVDILGPLPDDEALTYLALSEAQFSALLMRIDASFARDASGAARPIAGAGFTATDAFFEAEGTFNLLRTCNVWVSDTLRAAGVDFGIWTPTPQSVSLSLWWNGGGQSG
ncbi:MAG: TIGR02117 family protein [Tabrizicola sp.]|nr:TIGR02117 family protein [Tabrizicola sp.]